MNAVIPAAMARRLGQHARQDPGDGRYGATAVMVETEGLPTSELCRMRKDPVRNGNRTPEALVEHIETEHLVLWGWNPGGRRDPVPLPHKDFVEQMKIWVAGGTACPP